jgi:hypothetical protein
MQVEAVYPPVNSIMLTCASPEIAAKRFKDKVQLQWETD